MREGQLEIVHFHELFIVLCFMRQLFIRCGMKNADKFQNTNEDGAEKL